MWHERRLKLLKQEIEVLLAPLFNEVGFLELIKQPLAEAKRGLASESVQDPPWALLPLLVCQSISGNYGHVITATAALQLFATAGDIFDDIEDSDNPQSLPARYGSAIALNVATTILILAERAIARLIKKGVDSKTAVCILDIINSYYTTACIGQHLDLSLLSNQEITEEKYLDIISMKSASQIECACNIGAILAKANQRVINLFTKFGHNLGMAAQIANDILGISTEKDIKKNKITLPVIYALTQLEGKAHTRLRNMLFNPEYLLDPERIKDFLFRTGAMHYASIKLEYYKQTAFDLLSEAEKSGIHTKRLRSFLE